MQKKYEVPSGHVFIYSKLKIAKSEIVIIEKHDKELFIFYLKEAQKSFNKAMKQDTDNIMWEGFIKFNASRTSYLLALVVEDTSTKEDWYIMMNEAITARYRTSILIDDILQDKETIYKKLSNIKAIWPIWLK